MRLLCFLFIFCLFTSFSFQIDLKSNQTLHVLYSTANPGVASCLLSTSWSSSTGILTIQPAGECFEAQALVCQAQTLQTFFPPNSEELQLYSMLSVYLPDPQSVLIPLQCSGASSSFSRAFIENGKTSLTLYFFSADGSTPIETIGASINPQIDTKDLEFSGAVLKAINSKCNGAAINGKVALLNFLQNKYETEVTFFIEQLTIGSSVYPSMALNCEFTWLGAELRVSDCHSPYLSDVHFFFTVVIFEDGFVWVNANIFDQLTKTNPICDFVFRNRETL